MAKSNAIASMKAEDDWQVESDMRTLMEAEAIQRDPKRMAKVKALAQKKMMDIAAIASKEPDAS